MKIDEAISVARQFDRLYVQVMREKRKRHPDHQRINQLSRDARKVSKRLSRLLRLLSPKPRRAKQDVKQ